MAWRGWIAAAFIVLTVKPAIPMMRQPESSNPSPRLNSWIVYWDGDKSLTAARDFASHLSEISVFAADFDSNYRVSVPKWAFTAIQSLKQLPESLPIALTVVNDVRGGAAPDLKSPECIHEVIATPNARATHIDQLLDAVENVDTLEIDYESLWRKDREAFSAFIQDLAAQLHSRQKKLTVIVEPKTTDVRGDKAGAMDWKTLAQSADTIKIMAYLYHSPSGRPGPIAPARWVEDIARYALTEIPTEKLSVALTVSGCDWPEEAVGKSVDYQKAMDLQKKFRAERKWDVPSNSPFFRYTDNNVEHEVWYEDAQSIGEKIKRLQGLGINNVGLWRLGSGDPKIWTEVIQR